MYTVYHLVTNVYLCGAAHFPIFTDGSKEANKAALAVISPFHLNHIPRNSHIIHLSISAEILEIKNILITGCLQLLEILEISLNLYGPPGNFCVKCR